MKTKHQLFEISIKLLLKDKQGEFLLLKIGQNSNISGYYDFPGGRINTDELDIPFKDILKREVTEELGEEFKFKMKPKPAAYGLHWYSNDKNKKVDVFWLLFEGEYLGGKIKLSDEHEEYMWSKITPDNLEKLFQRGPLNCIKNYLNF